MANENGTQLAIPTGKTNKIRILTLSDHPMSTSGIAIQAKQLFTGLLDTGKYQIVSLGAALKHKDNRPVAMEQYGSDWVTFPIEGFGDSNQARQWLLQFKPDAVFLFTDPRFFMHIFQIEDEVRDMASILLWTVWDNEPVPKYNIPIYNCCDEIAFFSRYSYEFHKPIQDKTDAEFHCIPLARPHDIFQPLSEDERRASKVKFFGWANRESFTALYVSRNARRKRPADIMVGWRKFLDSLPPEELTKPNGTPMLVMHCDPFDHEGPNIHQLVELLDLEKNIMLSPGKADDASMNALYNAVDVTINFSLNEGFGMSVHESLLAGTPVIATATGGMTEQMTDGTKEFGILMHAEQKLLVGSQQVPYIYEDIVSTDQLANSIWDVYKMSPEQRRELGMAGRAHLEANNRVEDIVSAWDKIIENRVASRRDSERVRYHLLEV